MSFYKLNKDYIESFRNNVIKRYNSEDKRSETGLLRSIFKEVNELFRKVGGQLSSKRELPRSGEYPSSEKYNNLVQDICFDIDKLYNAQAIIDGDIRDLINFNSSQRDRTFENFASIQQSVYSAYIKSKKDLIGGLEVPAGNPFTSADGVGEGCRGIFIDEDRGTLTLACDTTPNRIADTKFVGIYFAGTKPTIVYPSNESMGVGSHWKKAGTDVHFIDQSNPSEVSTYKSMMIDDPDNNIGVGFSEFEAVETINSDTILNNIKEIIGGYEVLDPELVVIDKVNSLQGKYIKDPVAESNMIKIPRYKLVIPFTTQVLTNEIIIEFTANDIGFFPLIIWSESKVFSNSNGSDTAYELSLPQNLIAQDGRYVCKTAEYVYPTRLELILEYNADQTMWSPMPFMMSHYAYTASRSYEMPTSVGAPVSLNVKKKFEIYVDSEANTTKEKTRAINVLLNPNRTV